MLSVNVVYSHSKHHAVSFSFGVCVGEGGCLLFYFVLFCLGFFVLLFCFV